MKKNYYVNKRAQSNGDHEVHESDCRELPSPENREYLGLFYNCHEAVSEARRRGYRKVDGCKICSKECHNH